MADRVAKVLEQSSEEHASDSDEEGQPMTTTGGTQKDFASTLSLGTAGSLSCTWEM